MMVVCAVNITFVLFFVTLIKTIFSQDLLCTLDYCTDYIVQNGCPTMPDVCNDKLVNSSVAKFFPSPTICNCCETCLVYLGEGDVCVKGISGAPTTMYICGPGLTCVKNDGDPDAHCQTMDTECAKLQKDYDNRRKNGKLKMTEVRPQCDDNGEFGTAHCIQGSLCYCTAPTGERIFGEQVYTSSSLLTDMDCGCSRSAWTGAQLLDFEVNSAHCVSNGSYDTLQCIDNTCLCVDTFSATPDISGKTVNLLRLTNNSLPCFNSKLHKEQTYLRECEKIRSDGLNQIKLIEDEGIIPLGIHLPQCTPDGNYARVQTNITMKMCVDPLGKQLESFAVDLESDEASTMDCNCARTRMLLQQAGITELPTCKTNGNFQEIQCYRGKCFCVDNNGNQLTMEVDQSDVSSIRC